jgi:hypothetical protein
MKNTQVYPFSIAANGSFPIQTEGSFFRILTATGALSVIGDSFGTVNNLLAGQGLKDMPFKRLTLVDKTGATNSGYIVVSDGNFVDDRITGEVSVIDGGKHRALSGASYIGGLYASVGAGRGAMMLRNPSAVKNLYITQVQFSQRVAGTGIYLSSHNANLTTNLTANISNKKFGGAASVATMWADNVAAVAIGTQFDFCHLPLSTPFTLKFSDPVVLTNGYGLVLQSDTVGSELAAVFEFFEEAV